MWPFKRNEPPPENDLTPIPVTLDEAHTYVQPRGDYVADYPYGTKDYSPLVGVELPTIRNQDAILVHWYRPPDAGNPAEWWQDNNSDELARAKQERFTTTLGQETTDRQYAAENPWLQRHPLPRVTSDMSPSNYRFERPFDQRYERKLNGNHFSMASNRRSYPVNGMQPSRSLRNTFRLEPLARDAENVDLSATETPAPIPATYVSPVPAQSSKWGL